MAHKRSLIAVLTALVFSLGAWATVLVPQNSVSYACDGVLAAFSITFPYQSAGTIFAYSVTGPGVRTSLTNGTDYTLNVNSTSTTATLTLISPSTSCTTGNSLLILRQVPTTQPQSFLTQGRFFPAVHEATFDNLEMQIQQLQNGGLDGGFSGVATSLSPGALAHNATITGDGSASSVLGVNLANANTWTAAETFTPSAGNTVAITANGHGTASGVVATSAAQSASPAITGTGGAGSASVVSGIGGTFVGGTNSFSGTSGAVGVSAQGGSSTNATPTIGGAGTSSTGGASSTGQGGNGLTANGGTAGAGQQGGTGVAANGAGAPIGGHGIIAQGGTATLGIGGDGLHGTGGGGVNGQPGGFGVVAFGGTAVGGSGGDGTSSTGGAGLTGNSAGRGGKFVGGSIGSGVAPGAGLVAMGGPGGNADGVTATGTGTNPGVRGQGGSSAGAGGFFTAGAGGNDGVDGIGTAGARGVGGVGGPTGPGAAFAGGGGSIASATLPAGVYAFGSGTSPGVVATAGATGIGLVATGGATSGAAASFTPGLGSPVEGTILITPTAVEPSSPTNGAVWATTISSKSRWVAKAGGTNYMFAGNPAAYVHTSTGTSIPSGGSNVWKPDVTDKDLESMYSAAAGTFTISVGKGGDYQININFAWQTSPGGAGSTAIGIATSSGSVPVGLCFTNVANSSFVGTGPTTGVAVSCTVGLTAGSVYTINITQSTGGAILVGSNSYVEFKRLSD